MGPRTRTQHTLSVSLVIRSPPLVARTRTPLPTTTCATLAALPLYGRMMFVCIVMTMALYVHITPQTTFRRAASLHKEGIKRYLTIPPLLKIRPKTADLTSYKGTGRNKPTT
jgi:hypothetical protein